MTGSQVFGNTRAGRTRLAVVAAALFSLIAFVLGPAAFAVHDTGAFELDGNATNSSNPGDDWDNVCHFSAPTVCPNPSNPSTTEATWTSDGNLNASIFTGGGSKDPQDIPNWAWKDGAGGLPDKDNLTHAFAARYSLTPSTTCPAGTALKCDVLYFGSDRYDNSGDAQQGFWFLQDQVGLGSNSVGGGTGFTGAHQNNDLLVISDFSNGGSTSTITVYSWNTACKKAGTVVGSFTCGDVNLLTLATSNNANCNTAGSADPFCGVVNPDNTTPVPWSSDYTDKSGNSTTYLQGELYEGGINLSLLNLNNTCFSSVVSETRSSTSTTATLKDFVVAPFAVCSATVSTTPSVTPGSSVFPGQSVTDTAVIQGQGVDTPPTPQGNVTFFICGPLAAGALCGSGGAQVGSTSVPLANSAPPVGEASATSSAVNTSTSPLTPGRYCFRAEWPGDTNYKPIPPATKFVHTGTGDAECFNVIKIDTTTVTTPSDSSGTALVSPVAFGTNLYDKAVVTGTAAGGTPTGNVDFFVCNPSQVQGAAGAETCATGGTALTGNPRPLSAVSGSSPPAASAISSPAVVGNTAGVWCFRAVYTPTGNVYNGSSDARHSECVSVGKADTTTVTTPSKSSTLAVGDTISDHAVVTGSSFDGAPTGTITFYVCDPTQTGGSSGSENCATGGTQLNTATASVTAGNPTPPTTFADSSLVTADKVGVWCFRAEYTPAATGSGANYNPSSDGSHTECFTVQDSTGGSSAQTWRPNDTGTVTASGSTPLNGELKIQLYTGDSCAAGNEVSGQVYTKTLTNATSAADRSLTTSNSTFSVSTSSSVSWLVTFTPTAGSFVTGSTHCENTSLTINN